MASKEALERSRDWWQQSVKHDKRQAMGSFLVACIGVATGTSGVHYTFQGELPAGIPSIIVGTSIAYLSYRSARGEIKSALVAQSMVAVREHMLEQEEYVSGHSREKNPE